MFGVTEALKPSTAAHWPSGPLHSPKMWELQVTDYSLQGLFRNFCRSCAYRSRSNSTGKHVCTSSIPLWAHVRNRVRRDKVGLICSVAAWGLCSGRKQGGTSLSAACLSLGSGEEHGGACLCSCQQHWTALLVILTAIMTVSKLSQNFLQLPLFQHFPPLPELSGPARGSVRGGSCAAKQLWL